MKKIILIIAVLFSVIIVEGQTTQEKYSPVALSDTFYYSNGDVGVRVVYGIISRLDNKKLQLGILKTEKRNGVPVPVAGAFTRIGNNHVDTVSYYHEPNDSTYVNTGEWFTDQVVVISIPLFKSMIINEYYNKVDPDSTFIKLD